MKMLDGLFPHDKNARCHHDKLVVKMPLEATQLLYTARHILATDDSWRKDAPKTKSGASGYAPYQAGGPLPRWVAASRANYEHCLEYGLALCREYSVRFPERKEPHACQAHLEWLAANRPSNLPEVPMTPIPILPKKNGIVRTAHSVNQAVRRYRRMYIRDKLPTAVYVRAPMPSWARKQLK